MTQRIWILKCSLCSYVTISFAKFLSINVHVALLWYSSHSVFGGMELIVFHFHFLMSYNFDLILFQQQQEYSECNKNHFSTNSVPDLWNLKSSWPAMRFFKNLLDIAKSFTFLALSGNCFIKRSVSDYLFLLGLKFRFSFLNNKCSFEIYYIMLNWILSLILDDVHSV